MPLLPFIFYAERTRLHILQVEVEHFGWNYVGHKISIHLETVISY